MVRLVTMSIRDLDRLVKALEDSGYTIEYGSHAVLPDNSEVEEIYVVGSDGVHGIIIAHYISQYYKVIIDHEREDDSIVLRKLLEVKYGGRRWRTPVSPVAILTDDHGLIEVLEKYRDEYPCSDAEHYSRIYRERNPDSQRIISGLLARALEKLTS